MSTTNPLLLALKAENCNVDETLAETLMGNEKLYERLLRKLPNTKCVERMASALEANDAKAFFEAGHELKGMYASLGLTPLFTLCSELVEITRKGEMTGVAENFPTLKARHEHMMEIILSH